MGIIVYWSLNSKSMCFVERFSLFIQIFFLCVGWKVKFLSNFNEPLGGPIASPGRVRRACRNLTEKAGLKANFHQPWIVTLVEAFTFSLKAKVYSVFVNCSVSLASPPDFLVPLELDRCWWFTFFLCTLCDERNDIRPFCTSKSFMWRT